MNNILLLTARILLIAGIIIICGSIMAANYNDVLLITNKAKLDDFERKKQEKYSVKKPEKPIDMSEYIIAPEKISKKANEAKKEEYKQELEEYNQEIKNARETYKKKLEEYNDALIKYKEDVKNVKFNMIKDETDMNKEKEEIIKKIQKSENAKNFKIIPLYIRYSGVFIFLIGALGILIFAEVQEKLGVLILIGLGFKCIIGE